MPHGRDLYSLETSFICQRAKCSDKQIQIITPPPLCLTASILVLMAVFDLSSLVFSDKMSSDSSYTETSHFKGGLVFYNHRTVLLFLHI